MRIQMFVVCAAIVAMMLFSPVSKAECGSKCQADAKEVGESAAREVVLMDVMQDEELGVLIRTGAVLDSCGDGGKSAAIGKLGSARMRKLLLARAQKGFVTAGDTEMERAIAATSFLAAATHLDLGYFLGWKEATKITFQASKPIRDAACRGFNKSSDELLFGNKND